MPALFESGVFGNLTPAWHGQGKVVSGALTTEEALKEGGLDWEVVKRPLFTQTDELVLVPVPDNFAIVRATDNSPLGVVGSRYQPIQNREAFEFVDFLLADKSARWETAISVNGGATIAGVLSLRDTGIEIRKGDLHYKFLTIITTHDGSGAAKVFPTDVRVVCANTVRAALGSRNKGLTVNIRHSGDVKAKASDAAKVLAAASDDFAKFEDWMRTLVELRATDAQFREVVNLVIPEPVAPQGQKVTDRQKSIHRNKVLALETAYKAEVKLLPQFAASTGGASAYDIFNSITRYVDRTLLDKKDSRFEYAMLTGGADLKASGIEAINKVFDVKVPA